MRYIDDETSLQQQSELRAFISKLSQKEATKSGINRKQLYRLKERIHRGDKLTLHSKTRRGMAISMKMKKDGSAVHPNSERTEEEEDLDRR